MAHDDTARDHAPLPMLSVVQIAELAGYHRGSIRRMIYERRSIGALAVKVGSHWRFRREDAESWLAGEIDGQQEVGT